MSAQPTQAEIDAAVRRSDIARSAALALAAQKSPEWRTERAKKAAAASVKAMAIKRAKAAAVRAAAGIEEPPKRKRYSSRGLPNEEVLRGYMPEVERQFPGLTYDQKRRQAAAMLRADLARVELEK
ncbi:hypothetical protein E3T28_09325 [Cryobacterium sinapicolor]|uniref:Uncharacterized protein n=1 Tax=Cryobacterium sinapicolor TaxID=1259236 RepID=A0ABY2J3N6_9MICO|nr:hypothetical protein [Cryobacterium sinapicolor]TFC98952.1 hypothetical protein E3T28_09325 [Cryobacterium sinapicolor]